MYTEIVKEFVFDNNMPFESCHASSLTLLANGDILAAWFAGSKEGADDVSIWLARRQKGVWSKPCEISDMEEKGIPHWNPVLFTRQDGTVLLFYKVGRILSDWYTKIKISEDNGETWSKSVELVPGDRGGRGPVRNKVIQLADGTLLAPGSTEKGIWKAFADVSTDGGNTWQKSNEISIPDLNYNDEKKVDSDIPVTDQSFKGRGVIQPTLWESDSGKVHMLLRSTEGRIYRSDSADFGRNWTKAYKTLLPNNNSGIDLVKIKNNSIFLVYNPVGVNWGPRTPLMLTRSSDNGSTWGDELILEDEEGEFSYPAIISDDKYIYLSYTWKRQKIAFWKISTY